MENNIKLPEINITLLIIFHKNFEKVTFFLHMLNIIKKCEGNIPVIFAFDADVSEYIRNKIETEGFVFYKNENNIGKLHTIMNCTELIKTDYFKIIDYDDSLFIPGFKDLISEINNINDIALIKHNGLKLLKPKNIFLKKRYFRQTTIMKEIHWQKKHATDLHYRQQTNFDTIFPTKIINDLKKYQLTRQEFHNDVLLSNAVKGLGFDIKYIFSEFYIQFHEHGQTGTLNEKRAESTLELYKNYLKIKEKNDFFNIKRTMSNYSSHVFFIKRFTYHYLKKTNPKKGLELYNKTIEVLNKLWKN